MTSGEDTAHGSPTATAPRATRAPGAAPPLIVQTGTYSSWNKGDAAMQLAMRDELAAAGIDSCVSAPFVDRDRPLYGDRIVRSHRRNLPLSALLVVAGRAWRALGGRPGALLGDREGRLLRDTDLVLDLSGDMLTDDYGPHVAISHYVPLLRAWALGRPYAIVAQSIGPFRWTAPVARRLLRGAALVTVRDGETAAQLDRRLPDVRYVRTADLAFLLEPAPSPHAAALADRSSVAVSLSSNVAGELARVSGLDLVDEMAEALDRLSAVHGTTTVLVAHVTGPTRTKDDRVLARRLAGRLAGPHVVIDEDLDPRRIKAIIGATEMVIGGRMHANVAGLSQGVPAVALAYSHKTPGIMGDLGLGPNVFDCRVPHRPGELASLVSAAWQRRAHDARTLAERLPATRRRARRNVDLVLDLVGGPRPAGSAR